MNRRLVFLASIAFISVVSFRGVSAHHHPLGHSGSGGAATVSVSITAPAAVAGVSGQGEMKFRLLYGADHLPREAVEVLTNAHGGFAIDRREGKGEIYFALPGAGLIQITPDLGKARLLHTAAEMRDTNLHNTTIWYDRSGTAYLTFPANQAGQIFTTTLDGRLLHTLGAPTAEDRFESAVVNEYFKGAGNFAPTDVEQLNGLFYITTGYSRLDFVLTARMLGTNPFKAIWHSLAFGGKGEGPGQFGTGHGITVRPGGQELDVADRPNSEIDRFSPDGRFLSTVRLPEGSYPCDIDYSEGYAVVACLHGPDRSKGAPLYILENDQLVSTIMPKEELGLEKFQHIHNAVLRKIGDKYYIIAQAWNPGDFAILEQVE